jgi:ABC-type molybdenum transport system ATPase subunit/photorepair protein PhrA
MNHREHKNPKKSVKKNPQIPNKKNRKQKSQKDIQESSPIQIQSQQINQKNISIKDITVTVPHRTLIEDSDLIVSYGHKYGLIGNNGSGKTTLLRHLVERQIPIPKRYRHLLC